MDSFQSSSDEIVEADETETKTELSLAELARVAGGFNQNDLYNL